jgi:anti-sigma factor RsiW
MTCREFVEFLMAYLDDDLEREAREVFEMHLGKCPSCMCYMDDYKKTIEVGKCVCEGENEPPPADAPPELVRAILEARKTM